MANETREVVVTNVQMPFWSMVFSMVKWSIASIPAFVILVVLGALAFGISSAPARASRVRLPRERQPARKCATR